MTRVVSLGQLLINFWTEIIDVDSGQKALQELEQRRFHMVLCDVLMPDIDGLELLTRIRKMEDCKQIPVIS